MKWVFIIFGLLLVLLDLAADGGLVRVKFDNLHRLLSSVPVSHLSLDKKIVPSVKFAVGLLSQLISSYPLIVTTSQQPLEWPRPSNRFYVSLLDKYHRAPPASSTGALLPPDREMGWRIISVFVW
jgi:hypothetical protein